MDVDEPGWPLIDDFFGALADGRAAATIRRYARIRSRLYAFLDTADLTSARGHDELALCLPGFLHETWLPDGTQEAKAQVTVVSRLLIALGRSRDQDRAVLERARETIAARPAAPAPTPTLPARFRRKPGAWW